MQKQLLSLWLVVAAALMSGVMSAAVGQDKKLHRRRRVRGDKRNSQGRQRHLKTPDLKDLEEQVEQQSNVLLMYQMDTSLPTAENEKYAASFSAVQPFYRPKENGASVGVLNVSLFLFEYISKNSTLSLV